MSALRLGRLPDGTRDVRILEPAVGRVTHTRGAIMGGIVVAAPRAHAAMKGVTVAAPHGPRIPRYPLPERTRCGEWMPRAHEKCYRLAGHKRACQTRDAVLADNERRRTAKRAAA